MKEKELRKQAKDFMGLLMKQMGGQKRFTREEVEGIIYIIFKHFNINTIEKKYEFMVDGVYAKLTKREALQVQACKIPIRRV